VLLWHSSKALSPTGTTCGRHVGTDHSCVCYGSVKFLMYPWLAKPVKRSSCINLQDRSTAVPMLFKEPSRAVHFCIEYERVSALLCACVCFMALGQSVIAPLATRGSTSARPSPCGCETRNNHASFQFLHLCGKICFLTRQHFFLQYGWLVDAQSAKLRWYVLIKHCHLQSLHSFVYSPWQQRCCPRVFCNWSFIKMVLW